MNTAFPVRTRLCASACGAAILAVVLLPSSLHGQAADKKNPASKVYITDVSGEAQIDTGDNVQELAKRSVYNAQGTVIETKKAEKDEDKAKIYSTMVYSNGTGAFFDYDTRVEIKRFVQEPFNPNRGDMDVEPSISQTQAFVSRGAVGLCTSKLVAGSSMSYSTAQGSINIRGRKIVIEANDNQTKISMLDGESTVRGGASDFGGQVLHAGEQAVISPGLGGQPNRVEISRIPPNEVSQLDDKIAQACMAKKTVYFEVKESKVGAGGNTPSSGDAAVSVFNQTAENSNKGDTSGIVREIVPVEVAPNTLPVQFTVSPATLITPASTKGG